MNYSSICTALITMREQAGYTPEELSCYFGTDASLIERWESGAAEPTISECLILSKLYGVALDDMFGQFRAEQAVPQAYADTFAREARVNRMKNRWFD